MSDFRASAKIAALRAKVAAIESGGRAGCGVLPFGTASIDDRLPGGGLPLGRWHEIAGPGLEAETAAAPAAFAALRPRPLAKTGEAVWVLRATTSGRPAWPASASRRSG
jgi:protein ImuA